jgi:hypothetical protein
MLLAPMFGGECGPADSTMRSGTKPALPKPAAFHRCSSGRTIVFLNPPLHIGLLCQCGASCATAKMP